MAEHEDRPQGIDDWTYFYDFAESLRRRSLDDWFHLLGEIAYVRKPVRRFVALETISARTFRQAISLPSGFSAVVECELSREGTLEPVMGGLSKD